MSQEERLSHCYLCDQWLEPSRFNRDKTRSSGLGSSCKKCRSDASLARYHAGGAETRAQRRVYARAQRRKDPEANRRAVREWRKRNPEYVREADRRRHARKRGNPEKYDAYRREKYRQYRARKKGAAGDATPQQQRWRWDYYGGRCWMCGKKAEHMDHVKPLNKGGSNWPANLRPACAVCNVRKSDHWPFASVPGKTA